MRPLVRIFVEAHICARLRHLIRLLRIEAFGLDRTDPRAEPVRDLLDGLVAAEGEIFGWGRLRVALSKAPFIPPAVAFGVALVDAGAGIDLSNGLAFGRSAAESARELGPKGVLGLLSDVMYVGILAYAALFSPAVLLGFKRKRALFSGGITPAGDELHNWPMFWMPRGATTWIGFPDTDVYAIEDEVFARLSARRPQEIPVDIFSFVPYALLWSFTLFLLEAARDSDWLGVLYTLVFTALVVASQATVIRRRRAASYQLSPTQQARP